MPGFGDNPNTEDEEDGMFTQDMVKAVACYEATLSGDRVAGCRTPIPASDDEATTTTTTAASDATTTTTTEEPCAMLLHTLAGIAWDPQIRGFLATAVGVVVLMGSVYLLVGTNLGSRPGLLCSGRSAYRRVGNEC